MNLERPIKTKSLFTSTLPRDIKKLEVKVIGFFFIK